MIALVRVVVLSASLLLVACNTVEGLGRDMESAGDTVAKVADRSKP